MLKDMPMFKMFATGVVPNNEDGIFATREHPDRMIRWVAKRGEIHDWAIYYHWAEKDEDYVMKYGDKLYDKNIIRKLVPCDEEALNMYRR